MTFLCCFFCFLASSSAMILIPLFLSCKNWPVQYLNFYLNQLRVDGKEEINCKLRKVTNKFRYFNSICLSIAVCRFLPHPKLKATWFTIILRFLFSPLCILSVVFAFMYFELWLLILNQWWRRGYAYCLYMSKLPLLITIATNNI